MTWVQWDLQGHLGDLVVREGLAHQDLKVNQAFQVVMASRVLLVLREIRESLVLRENEDPPGR